MEEKRVDRFQKRLGLNTLWALDTTCFIYHIEENSQYIPFTSILFETLLPQGKIQAVASTLVLTEVLTLPMRRKRQDLVISYKSLIVSFPHLVLKGIDESVAETAAYFRAQYNLATPDAIHIASAYESHAQGIIGNDLGWKRIKELGVIVLDEFLK